MRPPYPWLEPHAERLLAQRQRWSHAWLISGAEGIGKYALARWLAHALLCESPLPTHEPCGTCTACQWLTENRHPDYYPCLPENAPETPFSFLSYAENDWIKIDAIRSLAKRIYLPAHRHQAKVILIYPAELVNLAASNALLKLLEEPPANTYLLLVAHRPHLVLPTLRSRCNALTLPLPEPSLIQKWEVENGLSTDELAHAGQSPLKALALKTTHQSFKPLLQMLFIPSSFDVDAWKSWLDQSAKNDKKTALAHAVDSIQKALHDWLRASQGLAPRFFPSQNTNIYKNLGKISIPKLLNLDHALSTVRQHSKHPLNPTWLLENVVIQYAALWSK